MAILERRVQFGTKNEAAYREWEKTWEAIESRLGGFPPKRHYWLMSGAEKSGTVVWEREWENFAAMEAAYDKMMSDDESNQLGNTAETINDGERIEYYFSMD